MKLCAVSESLGRFSFPDAVKASTDLGLAALEIGTGNWCNAPHAHLQALLEGQILAQGAAWPTPAAKRWTRAGFAHPEGFFDPSPNCTRNWRKSFWRNQKAGLTAKAELAFPEGSDGARGVAFVESAMRSFAAGDV